MTDLPAREIEAGKGERHYWSDLWRYRQLVVFFAWRDFLVRYKQAVLGLGWAILKPLITMALLVFVFGRVAKLPSGNTPYPLLVMTGLLPWQFFSSAIAEAGNSMIGNANMISKIYFPRLVIPASSVVVCLVDLLLATAILGLLLAYYDFLPNWRISLLPVLMLSIMVLALGTGIWLAALTVKYRDFRYIVPFLVQIGLYASPVGFSSSIVPPQYKAIYSLNPLCGYIDAFRWVILGGSEQFYLPGLIVSLAATALILITGIAYFRSVEREFADII